MNYGDDQYMQTLFGVDAAQAAASGLTAFDADDGFVSYGVSANAIIPMTDNMTVTIFPALAVCQAMPLTLRLFRNSASRDQAFFGLATAYTF